MIRVADAEVFLPGTGLLGVFGTEFSPLGKSSCKTFVQSQWGEIFCSVPTGTEQKVSPHRD